MAYPHNNATQKAAWVFGYGSLIWRPDIPFISSARAQLAGYSRRFWQGSHDHRGLPENPGRVVTLVPDPQAQCIGMAYLVPMDAVAATFEKLDHREKNGYERHQHPLQIDTEQATTAQVDGLVYIASVDNFAFLGDAATDDIARQIIHSAGPSGTNLDYLLQLAQALRSLNAHDEHVFELEYRVQQILEQR